MRALPSRRPEAIERDPRPPHRAVTAPSELGPLPLSKRTRVMLELVRTLAACGALLANSLVLSRVFGLI